MKKTTAKLIKQRKLLLLQYFGWSQKPSSGCLYSCSCYGETLILCKCNVKKKIHVNRDMTYIFTGYLSQATSSFTSRNQQHTCRQMPQFHFVRRIVRINVKPGVAQRTSLFVHLLHCGQTSEAVFSL